jgi:hypothetical protein
MINNIDSSQPDSRIQQHESGNLRAHACTVLAELWRRLPVNEQLTRLWLFYMPECAGNSARVSSLATGTRSSLWTMADYGYVNYGAYSPCVSNVTTTHTLLPIPSLLAIEPDPRMRTSLYALIKVCIQRCARFICAADDR